MCNEARQIFPVLVALAIACLLATGESPAQTKGVGLAEIIVTARKREEPLADTPLSITALTHSEIELYKLTDLSQVAAFAPNVEFDFTAPISGSGNTASVFIRGVGQTDYVPSKDPGVGIYLNGVYIARSVGAVLNLLDVDRVDILRGPQGTLFGRNTVGGAINVVTIRPGDTYAADIDLTIGSLDRGDLRASMDTPLTETLFARWSFGYFRRDGYMQRIIAGDRAGDDTEEVGRASLRWIPSDRFTADLDLDFSNVDEQSTASKLLSTSTPVPVSPFPIGDPQTLFAGQAYNVLIGADNAGASTLFPFLPPLPPDSLPYDSRWLTDSALQTNATGPNYSTGNVFGATATVNWSLPSLSITSITGYRRMESNFGRDPDGSPLVIGQSEVWVDHDQLSQELQFVSRPGASPLDLVGGLFYLTETGRQRDLVPFVDETFRIYEMQGIPIPNFLLVNGNSSVNSIDSLALFGEAVYPLTDRVEIAAGLRWTRENRETVANTTQGGLPTVANPRASMAFDETTSSVSLKYDWNDAAMSYARYAEGFKSGGFNHRLARPNPDKLLEAPTRFAPEYVKSVEVGLKLSHDERVLFSAAVFHSLYENIQVAVFDVGVPRTINAAEGKIDGVEIELDAALNQYLRARISYGYLDASFTRLDDSVQGAFGQPVDNPLTLQHQFVNSPKHSLSLGMNTDITPAPWPMQFWADATYRSEVANDAINTPELVQPEIWLFNAGLSMEPVRCRCEISIFAQNLTDQRYFVSGAADSPSIGAAEAIMARPREWGLRLRFHFD